MATTQQSQPTHPPVVQLAVDVDLPLCDVPGEVWDGVGNVVVGHGQDGQLRDGALAPLNAPCSGGRAGQGRGGSKVSVEQQAGRHVQQHFAWQRNGDQQNVVNLVPPGRSRPDFAHKQQQY